MEAKLKEPEYINWIKSTLALSETKDALQEYVETVLTEFYLKLMATISNQYNDHNHNSKECACNIDFKQPPKEKKRDSKNSRKEGKWEITTQCSAVEFIFGEISKLFDKPSSKKIYWSNTKLETFFTHGCWVIARIFMPQGNTESTGFKDTDAVAIFNLLNMCGLFEPVDHALLDKIIKQRNMLMHSNNNLVKDADMNCIFDRLVELLKFDNWGTGGGTSLKSRQECQEAVDAIENLRRAALEITLKLEYKALDAKQISLGHDIAEAEATGVDAQQLRDVRQACEDELEFGFGKEETPLKQQSTEELEKEKETLLRENELLKHSSDNLQESTKKEKEKMEQITNEVIDSSKLQEKVEIQKRRILQTEIGLLRRKKEKRSNQKRDRECEKELLLRSTEQLKSDAERHGVSFKDESKATVHHFRDNSEVRKRLEEIPDDRTLARLSHLLGSCQQTRHCEPYILVRILQLPRYVAETATSSENDDEANFLIFSTWKEHMASKKDTVTLGNLVEQLEKYFTWEVLIGEIMRTVPTEDYGLQPELLDGVPNEEQWDIVSEFVDQHIYQYVFLFLELGLEYTDIENAVNKKVSKGHNLSQLFLICKGYPQITIRVLINTIAVVNKDDDIKALVTKLADMKSSSSEAQIMQ